MALIDTLDRNELRDLLVKNWMTHDAMWIWFSAQEFGMEKTNGINRRAVRTMASIEAKRVLKATGRSGIRDFDDLVEFLREGIVIIKGGFMNFEADFPEKNRMTWDTPSCYAFDGLTKAGLIDQYECGVVERALGWFDGLGVRCECSPDSRACMMRDRGACRWEFRFFFD